MCKGDTQYTAEAFLDLICISAQDTRKETFRSLTDALVVSGAFESRDIHPPIALYIHQFSSDRSARRSE